MAKDKCCDGNYCNEVYREFNVLHDYYIDEINKLKSEIKDWEYKYNELLNIYANKFLKDANNE